MRSKSFIIMFLALGLTACQNEPGTENTQQEIKANLPASKLTPPATDTLISMLQHYFDLTEALVKTDAPAADIAANKLSASGRALDLILQKDTTADPSLSAHIDTISAMCAKINSMMDESCEHKRLFFAPVSSSMYEIIIKSGLKDYKMYRFYSVGAFNDKGAYWLSKNDDINNPYFGSKLLEEGELVDTIK